MPARNISLLVITSLLISCDSADVTHETAKQFVSTEYMCENKEYLSVVIVEAMCHYKNLRLMVTHYSITIQGLIKRSYIAMW